MEGTCHGEAALRQHRNVGDNHVPEPPATAALSAFRHLRHSLRGCLCVGGCPPDDPTLLTGGRNRCWDWLYLRFCCDLGIPGHQWTLCFPLRLIPSETLLKTITSDCLSPSVRNTREKASISVPSSSTSSLWLSYSQDIQTTKLAGRQNILSILFS